MRGSKPLGGLIALLLFGLASCGKPLPPGYCNEHAFDDPICSPYSGDDCAFNPYALGCEEWDPATYPDSPDSPWASSPRAIDSMHHSR